ncbi:MAG: pseudouridine synthase [Myxococcota bacterium]
MIPSRLDKYLADATPLSRSEIGAASEAGRIAVRRADGTFEADPVLWELVFDDDQILVDDNPVLATEPEHYFAFNKPAGVLTTASDPHGRLSLEPWLLRLPPSLFPVGRLDRATTGLLLLTDDGDLSHVLLRPRFHVEKRYHLTISGELRDDDPRLHQLIDGVDIGTGPAFALRVEILAGLPGYTLLELVIDEGRNRVVRKMCSRVRLELEHLHRAAIGPVRLGDVHRGDWRELTADEVSALWQAGGGRERAGERKIAALRDQAARWRAQDRPHTRLERWLASHDAGRT